MFITFSNQDGSITEQLDLSLNMDVSELKELLAAILDIPATQQLFISNGKELETSGTLSSIGIKANDLIIVVNTNVNRSRPTPTQAQAATNQRSITTSTTSTGNHAQLQSQSQGGSTQGTYWEGMSFHDVLEHNSNPEHIVSIFQSTNPPRPHLLREANFHSPKLAEILAKPHHVAVKELRKFLMLNSALFAVQRIKTQQGEESMRQRLTNNANDVEAQNFFKEKERMALIEEQYRQVMTEYPESLTRVLMLYVDVKINGVKVQAFVDSGAQTSVMSLTCAKNVGIDGMIDDRFAAKVVGVGSGKSLGRVHLTLLEISQNFFPVSVTVLDGEKGLGDKNMEFLLGLDMLRRHNCAIDLVKGVLRFQGHSGAYVETPFLHEKDLDETKGGTKGFDPNKPIVYPADEELDDANKKE